MNIVSDQLLEILANMWPMLFIFSVISISLRLAHFIHSREKFVLYRELLTLLFLLYILVLYYMVTYTDPALDVSEVGFNLTPFKEILRYDFDSPYFFKNVVGNILLFVPFGMFSVLYLRRVKAMPVLMVTLITSISIEATQRIIGRVFDVDDIILNVMGGFIGYILFRIMDRMNHKLPRWARSNAFKNVVIILISILIAAYVFQTYIPMIGGK